jgi:UDP-N-acetylmuramoyl-tripeptide--D-alanyl-D-alanine ligase
MEALYLKELIRAINGNFIAGTEENILIHNVSIDSRTTKKGDVYFAIQGKRYNGHDFIQEAIDKGAVAIVYSQDDIALKKSFKKFPSMIKTRDALVSLGQFAKAYKSKYRSIKTVGITGSNGKTTTKEILASILSKKGKTLANKGNFNNRIGLPLSIFNLTSDIDYAVFEMGTSLDGEIKMLSDIAKPDIGVITNIGFSHLKTFVSPEGVFEEKRILFDNVKECGCIVINKNDKFLKKISKTIVNRQIITFALNINADVYAKNIVLHSNTVNFDLFYKGNCVETSISTKGTFNVANALAAASCAVWFGFSLEEIKEGIEGFTPSKMRMETVTTKTGVVLVNDTYNANPSSTKEAIQAILQSYAGKKINLVLGDMFELGNKSAKYHFELGKFINKQNLHSVNLFGEMSLNTKKAIKRKNIFYSKDFDSLLTNLLKIYVDKDSVFLFKASRSIKLEEIFTKFLNILEKKRR